jgi:hypothetical protein
MDFLLSNDEYFKWKSLYVKEDKKKTPFRESSSLSTRLSPLKSKNLEIQEQQFLYAWRELLPGPGF